MDNLRTDIVYCKLNMLFWPRLFRFNTELSLSVNLQDKSLPRQAASYSHLRAPSQQYHQLFPIELVIYYHLLNRLLNITIVYQQLAHSIPRHKHHFTQFCGGSEIPRLHHSIREGAWVGIGSDYDTQEVGVDKTSKSSPVSSRFTS